jgi:bis(5'-nucleosidyl)-tetraphosphatase
MAAERVSAGVVVLRHSQGQCLYLLLRAYRYWDFPKGEIGPGEQALEAARREVAEETGIEDLRFRWGEAFHETDRYGGGKVARYFVGETAQTEVELGVSPELGRPEHHEYRWLSYDAARELLVPRVQAALDWARKRAGCD